MGNVNPEELKKDIMECVEKIININTSESVRPWLAELYEKQNKEFLKSGGKWDVVLTKDGWKKF